MKRRSKSKTKGKAQFRAYATHTYTQTPDEYLKFANSACSRRRIMLTSTESRIWVCADFGKKLCHKSKTDVN